MIYFSSEQPFFFFIYIYINPLHFSRLTLCELSFTHSPRLVFLLDVISRRPFSSMACCIPQFLHRHLRRRANCHYDRNADGDQVYPKRKDGSERYLYDVAGNPVFARDRFGAMRYAVSVFEKELYPRSKRGPVFALDPQFHCPYYARDGTKNEYYPEWKGRERMIELADGEMLAARYATGAQCYPKDRHGNDYFPICKITKKPYYLRDERGFSQRPVTVNNHAMYLDKEEAENETENKVYEKKDALGSTVYTEDHKMKKDSVWTHVKEGCLCLLCGIITGLCI